MNNENTMRQVLLFSGMIALLILSFLFDLATVGLQIRNAEGQGYEGYLVVLFPVFEMVIVLAGLGLFWYLITSPSKIRWVMIAYILIGLLILYGMPLLFFLPVPVGLFSLIQFIQPGTYIFQAGAILAMAGILTWLMEGRIRRPAARRTDTP